MSSEDKKPQEQPKKAGDDGPTTGDDPFKKMLTPPPAKPLNGYRLLGKSGLRVSPLCLGGMNFGSNWKGWLGDMSKEETFAILDAYAEAGGNFIDTAVNYQDGESEERIGEWMESRKNRENMVIATKFTLVTEPGAVNKAGNQRKNLQYSVEKSLKTLKISYIDILYLHVWDTSTDVTEVMRSLNNLVTSGKVLYLGISDTPAWVVAKANTIAEKFGWAPFSVYQGRWSLGDRAIEAEVVPMCKDFGMALAPWGVLGSGKFSGKYKKGSKAEDAKRTGVDVSDKDYEIIDVLTQIAEKVDRSVSQVALRWLTQKSDATVIPILGCRKLSHFEDNLKAMSLTLTDEQIAALDKVSEGKPWFPLDMVGQKFIASAGRFTK